MMGSQVGLDWQAGRQAGRGVWLQPAELVNVDAVAEGVEVAQCCALGDARDLHEMLAPCVN